MTIQAGRLRTRVEIQQPARSSDRAGGFTQNWPTMATVWAEVRPLSGREVFEQMRSQSKISHKVTIRYRADVTGAMRLKAGGTIYRIKAIINPRNMNEALELYCEETAA